MLTVISLRIIAALAVAVVVNSLRGKRNTSRILVARKSTKRTYIGA